MKKSVYRGNARKGIIFFRFYSVLRGEYCYLRVLILLMCAFRGMSAYAAFNQGVKRWAKHCRDCSSPGWTPYGELFRTIREGHSPE